MGLFFVFWQYPIGYILRSHCCYQPVSIVGFCLRFAEESEVNLDDWKPELDDQPVMNACVVENGTYKVCSKTSPKTSDGS